MINDNNMTYKQFAHYESPNAGVVETVLDCELFAVSPAPGSNESIDYEDW